MTRCPYRVVPTDWSSTRGLLVGAVQGGAAAIGIDPMLGVFAH